MVREIRRQTFFFGLVSQPCRVSMMLECSTGEFLARNTFMHRGLDLCLCEINVGTNLCVLIHVNLFWYLSFLSAICYYPMNRHAKVHDGIHFYALFMCPSMGKNQHGDTALLKIDMGHTGLLKNDGHRKIRDKLDP